MSHTFHQAEHWLPRAACSSEKCLPGGLCLEVLVPHSTGSHRSLLSPEDGHRVPWRGKGPLFPYSVSSWFVFCLHCSLLVWPVTQNRAACPPPQSKYAKPPFPMASQALNLGNMPHIGRHQLKCFSSWSQAPTINTQT